MTHPFIRRYMLVLCGICVLLAASAYRPGAANAALAVTATAEATVSGAATPAATDTSAGYSLNAPTVGLAALSSYRAALVFTFTGTRRGQTGHWSKTYTMLASQKPAARQVTIVTAGDSAANESLWELNGVLYDVQGKNPCLASMVEKGDSLSDRWEPARFLDRFTGAKLVGSETANGLKTNHYTFDEHALGAAQATGNVWIASDGGYVVKYVLSSKGGADYFGDGSEGTAAWDYELTQVNKPLSITLPKDCPAGLVDAPMLPDATSVVRLPGLITYSTTASLTDATAFYQKQLPTLGWQAPKPPVVTDTAALLSFTQGGQHLSIGIATADGSTTVQIMLGAAAK
jgi:hypothetical protein